MGRKSLKLSTLKLILKGLKNQMKEAMKPKRQLDKIPVQDNRLVPLSTFPPFQSYTEIKEPSKHQGNVCWQMSPGN